MRKNIKKIQHILRFDLLQGIVYRWYVYILFALLMAFFAVDRWQHLHITMEHPGTVDILTDLLLGIEEYIPQATENSFEIPYRYFSIFVLMGLSASQYACREWKERGRLYLLHYGDKGIWWLGKCVWNLCNTVLLYLTGIMTVWIVAALGGNTGFKVSEGLSKALDYTMLSPHEKAVFLYAIVLGVVTVATLNQMQATLQVLFSPVLGFIIYMAVLISSVYYLSPYFMGNNLMLLRTRLFLEDGISFMPAIIISILWWVAFVIIGFVGLQKKDVLGVSSSL